MSETHNTSGSNGHNHDHDALREEALQVEWVKIERLFGSPSNPRINEAAVDPVAASLRRFGWRQPVVAIPSGEVIAGNTRLKAAHKLGMSEVPVVWFEGSDLEATAYAIADNRTHEFSEWDEPALAKLLQELRAEDSLDGVGYEAHDIDDLLAELDAAGPNAEIEDPDPEEPPATPTSRAGDLWILGDHRILCGDSTNADDVRRLLGGEIAALLSTDPPYCVNYTGKDRPIHNGKPSGKDWSHVYREVDIKDLGEFLDGVFKATLPHIDEGTAIYIWHAHVQQPTVAAAFARHGLLLHQVLIWVKPCAVFGHSYYRWRHEPCAFGWRQGSKPEHGMGQLDTVWEVDWEGKQRVVGNEHPTQKPLRLFEIPMEQHTRRGDLVLEPFSGSGSQLIAAERLGRRCRAMEISPAFVDVAIRRWQKATGKDAVLDGGTQTYTEIAEERRRGQQDPA
jgi:DNA modification methylase